MAYKQFSPLTIAQGGTDTTGFTTNATIYFDGTELNSVAPGTSGNVLTSNGSGLAPTYQPLGGGGTTSTFLATAPPGDVNSPAYCVINGVTTPITGPFSAFATIGGATTIQAYAMPMAGTLSNLYVWITVNSSTAACAWTLYKNGSATTLVASTASAGQTGIFTDLTHTVTVNAGDLVQWVASLALTGAQTIGGGISMVFTT